MTAALWIILVAIAYEVATAYRIRRAKRAAYALAIEHARRAALDIAERCQHDDGMDQYEIGRNSGAMETFNAISFLLIAQDTP